MNALVDVLRGVRVPFAEIWILGRPLVGSNGMQMVRLFPERVDVPFDFCRALGRSEKQNTIMRPEKRGTGMGIRSLGDIYLPIP